MREAYQDNKLALLSGALAPADWGLQEEPALGPHCRRDLAGGFRVDSADIDVRLARAGAVHDAALPNRHLLGNAVGLFAPRMAQAPANFPTTTPTQVDRVPPPPTAIPAERRRGLLAWQT